MLQQSELLHLVESLSNAKGASGFEYDVVSVLRSAVSGMGTVSEDCLHNLYVEKKENGIRRPRMLLDAHTDEVSFMIKDIRPNGTADFITLGGIVPYNLPAHKVLVHTSFDTWIPGIITSTPPHFMTEAERNAPLDEQKLYIDVGASSAEDALKRFGIRPGEPVVPDVAFSYDAETDIMIGKAFDCRLGCAAVVQTLAGLSDGEPLDVAVTAGFSVQEEVGTRGAEVTANRVKPDIAIVFEGCPADDTVVEPYASQTAIGKGPMLRFIDRRMITNPRYQRFALDLAGSKGIPVQAGVRTGGSTNGAPIHLSNAGVPVIVIGIPVRYIHTHYGIAVLADVQTSAQLAVEVIRNLTAERIAGF